MKLGIVIIMILVLALTGVFASIASAGSSTTTQIIHDASDGTVNGHYTAAQLRAALATVKGNPIYSQYSDVAGVLNAYLSSFSTSGSAATAAGALQTAGATTSVKLPAGQLDYAGVSPWSRSHSAACCSSPVRRCAGAGPDIILGVAPDDRGLLCPRAGDPARLPAFKGGMSETDLAAR